MTITIAEAAAALAERFDTEVPKVADMPSCFGKTIEGPPLEQGKQGPRMPVFSPANNGESPPEFLLSMARTFRIPKFTERLLQAVGTGALRVRDSDGLLLPEGTEGTESSWVDITEAQSALEKTGARFVLDDATANSGTPEKAAPPAPVVTSATLPDGVPAAEIVEKFKLDHAWAEKLKHIARNPFLKASGALMQQGCRKSATSNGMPNLFNPVKFAEMLIAREGKTTQQMKRIIEARFKPWQDAWDAAQAVDASNEWAE